MGISQPIKNDFLKQAFVNELKNMYWAENYFLKVLPKLQKAAGTRYLKACFKGHLNATQEHVGRLDQVFKLLNGNARGKRCSVLSSVISQTMHMIRTTGKNTLSRDIGLIDAARQMEIYEINKYTNLIKISADLGEFRIASLLEEILYEEKEAEETFLAVKEDTLNDEVFTTKDKVFEFDAFEAAEE